MKEWSGVERERERETETERGRETASCVCVCVYSCSVLFVCVCVCVCVFFSFSCQHPQHHDGTKGDRDIPPVGKIRYNVCACFLPSFVFFYFSFFRLYFDFLVVSRSSSSSSERKEGRYGLKLFGKVLTFKYVLTGEVIHWSNYWKRSLNYWVHGSFLLTTIQTKIIYLSRYMPRSTKN